MIYKKNVHTIRFIIILLNKKKKRKILRLDCLIDDIKCG